MQPLDFFEETSKHTTYKTLQVFLIFINAVFYITIPTMIMLIEHSVSFDTLVLVPILIVIFTIYTFTASTFVHAALSLLFYILSTTFRLLKCPLLSNLFKAFRARLNVIVLSLCTNLLFLVWYLQYIHFIG